MTPLNNGTGGNGASLPEVVSANLLARLKELVLRRTGMRIRERDEAALHESLRARMTASGAASFAEYRELLDSDSPAGRNEWRELVALLTTGESFFFRDRGQMSVLREKLLPELIRQAGSQFSLRLWSAGCSTGEEPYSLAILLTELLPDWRSWQLSIVGTDLNEAALVRARAGRYRDWSLRRMPRRVRDAYFTRRGAEWELAPEIRSLVTFLNVNLNDTALNGATALVNLDLILCRNVFIYFDRPVIAQVLRRFANALRPGGYLVSGHGELIGQDLHGLETVSFPQSTVYRRPLRRPPRRAPAPASRRPVPVPTPPKPTPSLPSATGEDLARLLAEGRNTEAVQAAERALAEESPTVELLSLAAEVFGNVGRLTEAETCCQRALELDAFAAPPYYVAAQLAQERGQVDEARRLLRRVVYLDDRFVAAYLDLGDLHAREGNERRARTMRLTAQTLLQALPADSPVVPYRDTTAGELLAHVTNLLAAG